MNGYFTTGHADHYHGHVSFMDPDGQHIFDSVSHHGDPNPTRHNATQLTSFLGNSHSQHFQEHGNHFSTSQGHAHIYHTNDHNEHGSRDKNSGSRTHLYSRSHSDEPVRSGQPQSILHLNQNGALQNHPISNDIRRKARRLQQSLSEGEKANVHHSPWYNSHGHQDRTLFKGMGLRWHSGSTYSQSERGSIKKPRLKISKKSNSIKKETVRNYAPSSISGDSLIEYGAGWMLDPPHHNRVHNSSHDDEHIRSENSSGTYHKRDGHRGVFNRHTGLPQRQRSHEEHSQFSEHHHVPLRHTVSDQNNSGHGHPIYVIPSAQSHKEHSQDSHHLHRSMSINATSRTHPDHFAEPASHTYHIQHPSIISQPHSDYVNIQPNSPTPSAYNFNNRLQPKRESLPKNLDDLDLSIKNDFEKLRSIYDKKDSRNGEENKNRLSTNARKWTWKRQHSQNSNKASSKGTGNYTDDYNNNTSSINSSNKSDSKEKKRKGDRNGKTVNMGSYFLSLKSIKSGLNKVDHHNTGIKDTIREEFDESHRRRKRNHVLFLVVVLMVVVVAVMSAVLAATLWTTQGTVPSIDPTQQNYSVVVANITLKILNREFNDTLLNPASETFQNLAGPYSIAIDELFLRSKLANVYCGNEILYFSKGSIYAASKITFLDAGFIKSSRDVENVIKSAEIDPNWKVDEALRLGEFVVCRQCIQSKVEFVVVKEKPEVLLHNLDTTDLGPNLLEPGDISNIITKKTTPKTILPVDPSTGKLYEDTTTTFTATTIAYPTATTTTSTSTTAPKTTTSTSTSTTTTSTIKPTTTRTLSTTTTLASTTLTTAVPATTEKKESTTSQHDTTNERKIVSNGSTTLAPTVITVSNVTASSLDGHVTVTCTIENPNDWSAVDVIHTSLAFDDITSHPSQTIVTLDPTDLYVTATISDVYNSRVRVIYDVSNSRISISVNISNIGCYDDGFVECSLAGHSKDMTSAVGWISITVPPSQPTLSLPPEAVENGELSPPLQCQADLGYPHWSMELSGKMPRTQTYHALNGQLKERVEGCRKYATLTLKDYPLTMQSNGTLFRCELKADVTRPTTLGPFVDEQPLLVVPASICRGRRDFTRLRHPYNCSLYIECMNQRPSMKGCGTEQCYDLVSGVCGVQSLIAESTDGILNEGLASVTCSVIHVTSWSKIYIRHVSPSNEIHDVISVTQNGSITWYSDSLRMRALSEFRSSGLEAVLSLWVYVLKCSDRGEYVCSVVAPLAMRDRRTKLNILAKPEPPVLKVPNNLIENTVGNTEVSCSTMSRGNPPAILTLEVKLTSETTFRVVKTDSPRTSQSESCLDTENIRHVTTAGKNGTSYRCSLTPSNDVMHLFEPMSEEEKLFVVPASICPANSSRLVAHPKDCRHFVQCSPTSVTTVLTCGFGLCFNVTSQQCDILKDSRLTNGGSNFCYPAKNGVFLPHPTLCDKYIMCIGGQEVIQHCEAGTLYAYDGECTNVVRESFCYRKTL